MTLMLIVFVLLLLGVTYYVVSRRKKKSPMIRRPEGYPPVNPSRLSTSDLLYQYDPKFPEFTNLLRLCSKEVPFEEMLKHTEIADALATLSSLSAKRKKAPQGKLVMNSSARLSPEDVHAARAAMTTIVRCMYDFEKIQDSIGNEFNESADKFLNSINEVSRTREAKGMS